MNAYPLIALTSLFAGALGAAEIPALEFDPFRYEMRLVEGGVPQYRLLAEGEALGDWAPLGLVLDRADLSQGLAFEGAGEVESIEERYRLVHGKASTVEHVARQRGYRFRGAAGARLSVVARLSGEGLAFRYELPEQALGEAGELELVEETTGFVFDPAGEIVASEYQEVGRWYPSYENDMGERELSAEAENGYAFPLLVGSGGWYRLFTEAGMGRRHAGIHVEAAGEGMLKARLPEPGENPEDAPRGPRFELPWASPWRVVMAAPELAGIVESNLITSLAAPSVLEDDSWVVPGHATWSWWSDSDSTHDTAKLKRFIDFSAEMGWRYSLVDANWHRSAVPELVAYARSKGVGLFYWYNSGGDHNSITEKPRGNMLVDEVREFEMAWLRDSGIIGIKVDFFQSDKQQRIEQHLDILEDAAEHRLLVNFHGCTLPRGWSRTYPNMVTMESVRGGEVHRFGKEDWLEVEPRHNVNLVFTRNVIGPMDYTPGNVSLTATAGKPRSTVGHQLALGVAYHSGVQHWVDDPDRFRELGEEVLGLLKELPVAWDETRLLAGEPHRFAIVARRKGEAWWIAGVNGTGEAREVGIEWGRYFDEPSGVRIFADGEGGLVALEPEDLRLAPFGGFVAAP